MRWETLQFWGLGERMASFMKRRRHLESYWEIKLERARGKKFYEKTTTQLRAEAMEQEAQNAYDKYFEEQEARGKMKEEQWKIIFTKIDDQIDEDSSGVKRRKRRADV